MAHRGRLNVLANIVGKSYAQLFREFEGYVDPDSIQGSGDVKYHLGAEGALESRRSDAAGRAGCQPVPPRGGRPGRRGHGPRPHGPDPHDRNRRFPVLPILMHGDAAFAGQGVVAETLNLSLIKGYRVGGTIHVIVNNQLGFTTPPTARSSEYCTDIAKTVQAPIIHVNGDDPEACVRVARLAFAYRHRFHKDVVIDMVCYRRHGHNEGDDPSYTQPLMYRTIEQLRSVRKRYVETLVRRGDFTMDEAEQALADFQGRLQTHSTRPARRRPTRSTSPRRTRRPRACCPRADRRGAADLDRVYAALVERPRGLPRSPQAGQAVRRTRRDVRRRRGRLGARRGAGVRLAARRGHLGPPHRPGLPTRHLLAPALHVVRLRERRRVRPLSQLANPP